MNVQLRYGTFHYLDRGTGLPIVFLHAFPLDSAMWEPQAAGLGGTGRVIAPDIRGFGQSAPSDEGWTLDDIREDLREFLDALAIPGCALMGLSMGGYIALHFCRKYPERVTHLLLADTRARADNEAEKNARTQMVAALEKGGARILADRMLPRLLSPNARPEVVQRVRSAVEKTNPRAASYALMAMRDREDSSMVLDRIACPALVLVGEQDAVTTLEECRLMAERVRGARLVSIPNAGHLSNVENAPAFNRAVREFLGF